MRAISLWQPFATLVAVGAKQIETRSWRAATHNLGLVAIHAAKNRTDLDLRDREPFRSVLVRDGAKTYKSYGEIRVAKESLPLGCIVAVVTLTQCLPTQHVIHGLQPGERFPTANALYLSSPQEKAFGDYTPGRWAWILDDVRRLPEPIPARGQQGIWDLDAEIVVQIEAQLRRNPS